MQLSGIFWLGFSDSVWIFRSSVTVLWSFSDVWSSLVWPCLTAKKINRYINCFYDILGSHACCWQFLVQKYLVRLWASFFICFCSMYEYWNHHTLHVLTEGGSIMRLSKCLWSLSNFCELTAIGSTQTQKVWVFAKIFHNSNAPNLDFVINFFLSFSKMKFYLTRITTPPYRFCLNPQLKFDTHVVEIV